MTPHAPRRATPPAGGNATPARSSAARSPASVAGLGLPRPPSKRTMVRSETPAAASSRSLVQASSRRASLHCRGEMAG